MIRPRPFRFVREIVPAKRESWIDSRNVESSFLIRGSQSLVLEEPTSALSSLSGFEGEENRWRVVRSIFDSRSSDRHGSGNVLILEVRSFEETEEEIRTDGVV